MVSFEGLINFTVNKNGTNMRSTSLFKTLFFKRNQFQKYMSFHTIISEFRTKLTSPQSQAKITHTDIDQFYNKLNKLNFIFFKKYYRKYINNLNRLKPDPEDQNPDWSLLQIALAENEWKPTKPFAIFMHYLKYDNALTSKPFVAYLKKQNRKKLNEPVKVVKEDPKPKAEKEWTRVPIPRNRPTSKND